MKRSQMPRDLAIVFHLTHRLAASQGDNLVYMEENNTNTFFFETEEGVKISVEHCQDQSPFVRIEKGNSWEQFPLHSGQVPSENVLRHFNMKIGEVLTRAEEDELEMLEEEMSVEDIDLALEG